MLALNEWDTSIKENIVRNLVLPCNSEDPAEAPQMEHLELLVPRCTKSAVVIVAVYVRLSSLSLQGFVGGDIPFKRVPYTSSENTFTQK